jgi:hypothetical protein
LLVDLGCLPSLQAPDGREASDFLVFGVGRVTKFFGFLFAYKVLVGGLALTVG